MLVELRACGTCLDGAELMPSTLGGVSLQPWLRYHQMKSYASIDLPSANYTPLSDEWLAVDVTFGQPVPPTCLVHVPIAWGGTLNAVVWTWEVRASVRGYHHAVNERLSSCYQ